MIAHHKEGGIRSFFLRIGGIEHGKGSAIFIATLFVPDSGTDSPGGSSRRRRTS
jgi:hypothetical protein